MYKKKTIFVILTLIVIVIIGCVKNDPETKYPESIGLGSNDEEFEIIEKEIEMDDIRRIDIYCNGRTRRWVANFIFTENPQIAYYRGDEEIRNTNANLNIITDYLKEHWNEFTVFNELDRYSDPNIAYNEELALWEIHIMKSDGDKLSKFAYNSYPSIWNDFIDVLNETLGEEYIEKVEESLLEN